ncbi:hypothetical protein MLD38_026892 [Melastoma candidum]|uniref:Uncharacterized protein n=1 Tax=Melastoma candidum TaxID=119954 RepID=A0ACB9P0I0_9MYRT|nr:hypothetical protein MLD38_026892 [Melastoma candidum]
MASAAAASPPSLLLILSVLFVVISSLSLATCSHFEGFDDPDAADDEDSDPLASISIRSPPLTQSSPDLTPSPGLTPEPDTPTDPSKPSPAVVTSSSFDFWDEDEFEGLPPEPKQLQQEQIETPEEGTDATARADAELVPDPGVKPERTFLRKYVAEIACVSFLVVFGINYFMGKKKNEDIALAWARKFATKDSIFEKNFSLLGVGSGDDSPLLLKEGHNVFKFYATGRRYCQGLLGTIELKSRHDLISRVYNLLVPGKDEITFEVYMNDDAMDHIVFALARKKAAKAMQKETGDLQKFAAVLSPPVGRKWVADELAVISESKEVSGDLITAAMLHQVFGEKTFDKFGKGFISMHFSDQYPGSTQRKLLSFKFALPDVNHMADMTRLVALVPYYIDLIGRYKLSPQARSKTEAARLKAAQEAYKELQNARQEALHKKKAEKRKLLEEAEAKLSAEAMQKREAKEHARQMKKAMPKMKMSRGH